MIGWLRQLFGKEAPPEIGGTRAGFAFVDPQRTTLNPTDEQLIRTFSEVVYKCARINADACASIPIRLFTTKRGKTNFATRGIDGQTKTFIRKSKPVAAKAVGDVREVEEHPVLDLIENTNEFMDGFNFVSLSILYLEIVGRVYWFFENDPLFGLPKKVWVIPPQDLEPKYRENSADVEYYRVLNSNSEKRIAPENINVHRTPSLRSPYKEDDSPARAAYRSVGVLDSDIALANTILGNMGRPPIWMTPKDPKFGVSPAQTKRLRARLKKFFRFGREADFMITQEAFDVHKVGLTANELQQVERARVHTERIYNAFSVPVALGTSQTNLANLDASIKLHAMTAIKPRLTMLFQSINQQFVSKIDPALFLWFDDPVPSDVALERKVRESQIKTGERTINELREDDGQMPSAWGEKPWFNQSMVQPSDDNELNERSKKPAPVMPGSPGGPPPNDEGDDDPPKSDDNDADGDEDGKSVRDNDAVAKLVAAYMETPEPLLTDAQRRATMALLVKAGTTAVEAFDLTTRDEPEPLDGCSKEFARAGLVDYTTSSYDKSAHIIFCPSRHWFDGAKNYKATDGHDRVMPRGKDLEDELKSVFRDQLQAVIRAATKEFANVREKSPTPLPNPMTTPVDLSAYGWDEAMQKRVNPFMELHYEAGAKDAIRRIGVGEFDIASPGVQNAINQASFDFCAATNATTSLNINNAIGLLKQDLAAGIVAGANTIPELTKRVRRVFDQAEKYRAERIARTEASRAVHLGQREAAKQSGVVKGFQWLLSSDPCPFCIEIAESINTVDLNGSFGSAASFDNGPKIVHPAYDNLVVPPAHPNCVCTLTEIIDEGAL